MRPAWAERRAQGVRTSGARHPDSVNALPSGATPLTAWRRECTATMEPAFSGAPAPGDRATVIDPGVQPAWVQQG